MPPGAIDGVLTREQNCLAHVETLELPLAYTPGPEPLTRVSLANELPAFRQFGQSTRQLVTTAQSAHGRSVAVPTYVNEFWTAAQRAANRLHEVSYRACFKPQLPRFFIDRLTRCGDIVYDPFMGRGTTLIEAALLGRVPFGCDVNPLSIMLTRPRLNPPALEQIEARLGDINFTDHGEIPDDLLVFYHADSFPFTLCRRIRLYR